MNTENHPATGETFVEVVDNTPPAPAAGPINPVDDTCADPECGCHKLHVPRGIIGALSDIQNAARTALAVERRERLVASILDSLAPLDAYADLQGGDLDDERDVEALIASRYVTTLADALGTYIESGEITRVPSEIGIDADPTGTIDGE